MSTETFYTKRFCTKQDFCSSISFPYPLGRNELHSHHPAQRFFFKAKVHKKQPTAACKVKFQPVQKYGACHDKWHSNQCHQTLHLCTCPAMWHPTTTHEMSTLLHGRSDHELVISHPVLSAACHEKWHSNITKHCKCHAILQCHSRLLFSELLFSEPLYLEPLYLLLLLFLSDSNSEVSQLNPLWWCVCWLCV